jgi:hypothetical protein
MGDRRVQPQSGTSSGVEGWGEGKKEQETERECARASK